MTRIQTRIKTIIWFVLVFIIVINFKYKLKLLNGRVRNTFDRMHSTARIRNLYIMFNPFVGQLDRPLKYRWYDLLLLYVRYDFRTIKNDKISSYSAILKFNR